MKKTLVTFVLTPGGHSYEALALVDRIGQDVEPSYIGFKGDRITEHKLRIPGPYFTIWKSMTAIRKNHPLTILRKILPFVPAVIQSIKVLRKTRSKALVALGGGPSAAPIIAAWLTNRSVIYIESLCRVQSYSLVGRMAYLFFADVFIVQWKEMLKLYPKATWAGRLL